MTPENRYTNAMFIDSGLIYSEEGAKYFIFLWGALEVIEKHWASGG